MTEQPLYTVRLGDCHGSTGKTRHLVDGSVTQAPASLRISRYGASAGFSLLYLDEQGHEMTDTWHQSVEDAMEQATYEFRVEPGEWSITYQAILERPGKITRAELLAGARGVAQEILDGRRSPYDGVIGINALIDRYPDELPLELHTFRYAHLEWDDRPEDSNIFAEGVVLAAKDICAG